MSTVSEIEHAIENLASDRRALKQFLLWSRDHSHPSLHFKRVGRFWSARVNRDYRVLGLEQEGTIHRFYIGPHDGYEARL